MFDLPEIEIGHRSCLRLNAVKVMVEITTQSAPFRRAEGLLAPFRDKSSARHKTRGVPRPSRVSRPFRNCKSHATAAISSSLSMECAMPSMCEIVDVIDDIDMSSR